MKPTEPSSHGPTAGHAPVRYDDGVTHHHQGPGPDELHNEDVAHEHSDVNLRAIGISAAILAIVGIAAHVLMYFLFGWLERGATANQSPVTPLAAAPTQMPSTTTGAPEFSVGGTGPQLLTNEPMALQKHRAEEERRLQGYGWVNESSGIAHIPIGEAKKLLIERGVPVREGAEHAVFAVRPPVRGEASGGRAITIPLAEPPAAAPGEQAPQDPGQQPQAKPHSGEH